MWFLMNWWIVVFESQHNTVNLQRFVIQGVLKDETKVSVDCNKWCFFRLLKKIHFLVLIAVLCDFLPFVRMWYLINISKNGSLNVIISFPLKTNLLKQKNPRYVTCMFIWFSFLFFFLNLIPYYVMKLIVL